jgi:hypothetical protein
MRQVPTAVILTGQDLRHDYVRTAIAASELVNVKLTVRENKVRPQETPRSQDGRDSPIQTHFRERQASEEDFFRAFDLLCVDNSHPMDVEPGALSNNEDLIRHLTNLNPDVLICYGTSIIRGPLLPAFIGRFLNIHLGLSPYYRGGGTNFWPFVNSEPEFVGATFMHIDAGVDTGDIVHQLRPEIYHNDSVHSIGNRLIRDVGLLTPLIAANLSRLPRVGLNSLSPEVGPRRVYRRRDLTDAAVRLARTNLDSGLLTRYLSDKDARDAAAPIVNGLGDLK